jgi:hypothetical protein
MKYIINKASNPIKRIGLLFVPLSFIIAAGNYLIKLKHECMSYNFATFRSEAERVKDGVDYVQGNVLAGFVFVIGLILYFGFAEKLFHWVVNGNSDS